MGADIPPKAFAAGRGQAVVRALAPPRAVPRQEPVQAAAGARAAGVEADREERHVAACHALPMAAAPRTDAEEVARAHDGVGLLLRVHIIQSVSSLRANEKTSPNEP
jgi:hypothetical protein